MASIVCGKSIQRVAIWIPDLDPGQQQRTLVDRGLVETFADVVDDHISAEVDDVAATFRRTRTWHYPREAVREVVIHALAHRDWTRAVDIQVTIYSDRMEVVSPGRLPNSMTVAKMLAGLRTPRNPIIHDILRDYGYVDARGMGIRRKVLPLFRSAGAPAPRFEADEDQLKTTLYRVPTP